MKTKSRAERQRLEHVGAAPDAAVQHHRHAAGFGRDLGQRAQRGHGVVELAAAMIGDDHAVDAGLARDPRVRRRDQALDHELALPALADQLDMLPGELVALADVAHQVLGKHRRPAHRRPCSRNAACREFISVRAQMPNSQCGWVAVSQAICGVIASGT